ncbi:hypothetical protein HK097_008402 [Rhizophlyctis rosea]|uniref:Uncharacterized protein n=1 Tax=Rhizophlyctis rosea TaxID=64517 RepID=A0AAD5SBW2_9FUNG|nr:hypothetical protein HK097_008402 [Rhizophlyctis rosea]
MAAAVTVIDNKRHLPAPRVGRIRPYKAADPRPQQRINKAEREATTWYETNKKLEAQDAFQEKVRADLGLKEPAGYVPTPTYKVEVTNWYPDDVKSTRTARIGGLGKQINPPDPPLPPSLKPHSGPPPDALEINPLTRQITTTSEKAIQTMGRKLTSDASSQASAPADDNRMDVDRIPAVPTQNVVNNYVSNYHQHTQNVNSTQNHVTNLTHLFEQVNLTNVDARTLNTFNHWQQLNNNLSQNFLSDNRQFQQTNFNQMLNDQRRILHLQGAPADQLITWMGGAGGQGSSSRGSTAAGVTFPTRPMIEGAPTRRLIEGPGTRLIEGGAQQLLEAPSAPRSPKGKGRAVTPPPSLLLGGPSAITSLTSPASPALADFSFGAGPSYPQLPAGGQRIGTFQHVEIPRRTIGIAKPKPKQTGPVKRTGAPVRQSARAKKPVKYT